jgi:hypothetical protein
MGKYKLKTKENKKSVSAFLNSIKDVQKRNDTKALSAMIQKITGKKPKLWGSSIVGFDSYHYKYKSGQEGDWPLTGFSPRKQNLTIYIMPGFKKYSSLLNKIGKHKKSVSCLYVKRLEDLDQNVLKKMIADSVRVMKRRYR